MLEKSKEKTFISDSGPIAVDKYELFEILLEARDQKNINVDDLQKHIYRKKAGLCRFCCLFKPIRTYQMGYRFHRKPAEEIHYNSSSVIKNFGIQMVHGMDLVTDLTLAG